MATLHDIRFWVNTYLLIGLFDASPLTANRLKNISCFRRGRIDITTVTLGPLYEQPNI
jgi:hypothetical protein